MEIKFRKLKANEISVRVGRVIDTDKFQGVSLLLYKDARVDMDILDETVGAMNWQRRHSRDNANCEIGIWDSDKKEWVWKEDTGTESNTEAEKGLASDSFKRAGVNWGIGRELYSDSVKNILVKCELTEKRNLKKGVDWYVKEIGYIDNEISLIVIMQTVYGKDETEVFSFGKRKEQGKQVPTETPKEDKPITMTLEQAKAFTFDAKGKTYKLGECNSEQLLYLREHIKDQELLEGVELILTDMARKGYTEGQTNENNG